MFIVISPEHRGCGDCHPLRPLKEKPERRNMENQNDTEVYIWEELTPEEKLNRLKDLHDKGLITDVEYEANRKLLLESISK